jgi:hypothetical protein
VKSIDCEESCYVTSNEVTRSLLGTENVVDANSSYVENSM